MVLRARDIMESNVLTVDAGIDVLSCARLLADRHKGYAVLLGPEGAAAGIVTEWDFLSKVLAAGVDPAKIPVREIATATVRSCDPDTPAEDIVQTMANEGIRRIVVRSGRTVVGIVTSRNVLVMFREYVDKLSREIAGYHSDPTPLG